MYFRTLAIAAAVAPLVVVVACKPRATGQQKRYELKGKVVSVDRSAGKATIEHEDIPGYMPGMTMPFTVKEKWAMDVISEGDRVQATLVAGESGSWLEEIVIVQGEPDSSSLEGAGGPKPGDEVPDFALHNQDGKPITMNDYRGRFLLITFIYTRCPLPDYCPLMSRNFAVIEESLRTDPRLYAETHLLSVSVDPEYDKPAVLRSYGAGFVDEPRFDHWELATGTAEQVRMAAEYFGLRYWREKDQVIHSLATALIGPDGKVVKTYRGNEWKPGEVLTALKFAIAG